MKKFLFPLLFSTTLFSADSMRAQTVIFEDNFDSYTDFAISNVGSWTLTDVDHLATYGFQAITFPHSDGVKSFQVFNSIATTPPMTPSSTSNWTARSGDKMMVCFSAASAPWNNDWLISPKVAVRSGEGATLSFFAKSCDSYYGAEKFTVLVSTTGTAVSDFTPITSVTTTPSDITWHEYTYSLNAYTGKQIYIAIRCTSEDQFGFAVDDFKVVNATLPVEAPGCSTLISPADGATNLSYFTSQTLTWTAQFTGTGTADSYDVYFDKNPNPTTLVANIPGTSYTVSNLDPSSTYYWKVVPKNNVGAATGCSVYSFTTMAPVYCSAGTTATSWEKISNVTFADINNNSTSSAGYEDFTSIVGNVTAGSTYPFSASYSGTSYPVDQVIVWIDFNNDKDFYDAGEQVLMTPTQESPWTGSITIPRGATIGQTRMRVRLHDSSLTPNSTPCGTSLYGQVEDYTLNIGALGVSDVTKNGIKAYPNPVKDIFNIETQGKIKSVKVYDVTGKQILTKEINAAQSQIDFSRFSSGVYIVNTAMEDGTTTSTKVIKQ
ncbi:GEVED domain-containing protein [Chryseobacterium sp. SC28]|uniref:GEVED domain-containing protein n=1 Tax=Chryseobacterium sp. SC28 TaxID=2268028 RepID=UPI000F64B7B4|nr:GEVED domain-containing protein [Chryseobacterium sp. SC28]RRQ45513.1 T9SS C-terminal target domain-containing protein [Chryseobacterium sp. SC28]